MRSIFHAICSPAHAGTFRARETVRLGNWGVLNLPRRGGSGRFKLPVTAVALLLGGCRAPLAVNRSLVSSKGAVQDKNLLGMWRWQRPPGQKITSIISVYPLGKHEYVITWCFYGSPAKPGGKAVLTGTATWTSVGRLAAVGKRLWLSCRSLDPRFIYSSAMKDWWARRPPAGQPARYGAALRKYELATAPAKGMARVFYLVELSRVQANRVVVKPLLVPLRGNNRSVFRVPTGILTSRAKLLALIKSRKLTPLFRKHPWVFKKLSESQAEVYMPSQ